MLEIIDILRLIPSVFSGLFGFLPSWSLILFGSGSLLFIGLVVYKLLR